jgi:drug/metabolite transporter (DMT)-like permease
MDRENKRSGDNVEKLSRTRTAGLIVFLVLIWSLNWPATKIALSYTPPVLFSGMRTLLGGIVLLFFVVPRWKQIRFKKNWPIYVLSALFNIILYNGLQTVGLNYLPSGLFSAIVYLQPVLVGIFSWIWLGESMFGLKILGLILGFFGVGIISTGGLSGHISTVGILLALGSAVSWAIGTAYVKKVGGAVDPICLVTFQILFGGLFLTGLGFGVESWSSIVWNVPYMACLLFISIFVNAMGWLVYFILIGSGEASKVSAYTFLIPLFAILMGTLFMHEPFTLYLLAGMVLIVVSIYFVNRKPKSPVPTLSFLHDE